MGDQVSVFSEYSEVIKSITEEARTHTGLGKHHLMMHLDFAEHNYAGRTAFDGERRVLLDGWTTSNR